MVASNMNMCVATGKKTFFGISLFLYGAVRFSSHARDDLDIFSVFIFCCAIQWWEPKSAESAPWHCSSIRATGDFSTPLVFFLWFCFVLFWCVLLCAARWSLILTSGCRADRQNSPNGKHYLWLSSPFQRLGSVYCRLRSSPLYRRA